MKLHSLNDVLLDLVRDIYHAEKQLTKALPKMAKTATAPQLKKAFQEHLSVTEGHVKRLEQVFAELGAPVKAKTCHAMQGLVEEGKEVIDEAKGSDPAAVDAALIVAAQKVEHYEIASYGSARTFAKTLGLKRAVDLFQQTLDEETEADQTLTSIAEGISNPAAADQDDSDEDSDEDSSGYEDEDDSEEDEAEGRVGSLAGRGPRSKR